MANPLIKIGSGGTPYIMPNTSVTGNFNAQVTTPEIISSGAIAPQRTGYGNERLTVNGVFYTDGGGPATMLTLAGLRALLKSTEQLYFSDTQITGGSYKTINLSKISWKKPKNFVNMMTYTMEFEFTEVLS